MNLEKEMPDEKENEIVPYPQLEANTKIVVYNQDNANADVDAITQALANVARQADSPEKIQKVVDFLPQLSYAREIRLKQKENTDSKNFGRKIAAIRLAFRITASVGSVVIGLYLISTSPLFGPLLITLGIAGALEYKLKDVADLTSKINSSKTSSEIDKYNENQD